MSRRGGYEYYEERQILIRIKKEKPQKPKKQFWKGLLIYAVVLVLIMIGVLTYLWITLDKYQKGLEENQKLEVYEENVKRAPQGYFVSYVDGMTPGDWAALWKQNNEDILDSDDTINTVMEQCFNKDAISLYRSSDYSEDNLTYIIRNADTPLVKVKLEGSGLNFKVSEQEFYIKGFITKTITVPSDCSVYVNEKLLNEAYVSQSVSGEEIAEYQEELINPVSFNTYTIEGLLAEPVISVSGSHDLVSDEEGNYSYVLGEEAAEVVVEKAKDFAESLLYYFKMGKSDADAHMNAVLSHVVSGSKAASVIRASYDGVIWTQAGKNVNYDITTGQVSVLADNCYLVEISYHSDDEDSKELGISDGTYKIYFLDLGKGFEIYNFELK